MRMIQVSTEVYAAIWADRKPGEESEDAILARKFNVVRGRPTVGAERDLTTVVGFRDPKFGVFLDPGFATFRTFKGKEYRAHAVQGFWVLSETGLGYPSLNELSRAVGAGPENAWQAWQYIDESGKQRPMSDLRDPNRITKRNQRPTTLADLGLEGAR
jgi:hypothetical protein